ncbi:MFS transporter [Phenylobacterium sp. CCH9-H3]|jgi:MFS transporter, Spinster family, sphingosine-1-phosphate transporter|uniref:spinster family MFS transporter n=1 Tax=Phenylobacterium sp. CCH9-H3 TaxID=1768774 RepID=UPI00083B6CF2|nr:MFS transporter [Phenylobacterium sp. CCH9-H3]
MAAISIEPGDGEAPLPSVADQTDAAGAGAKPVGRPWLMAWMLMAVLTLNILDRQVINVLGNEIGKDLNLTDSQLGLVGGLAFSMVYFVFGFPWGWIADRPKVSRVWVISASLTIWSTMTALCGAASGYGYLLLARMGVAAGEAGCGPAAHSLIAESAPKAKLAQALAIFGLGIPIGAFLGKSIGGVLSDLFGWRSAFFLVGTPGVLLAIGLLFILRDPRHQDRARAASFPRPGVLQAAREVLRSRTIIYLMLGSTVMGALVSVGSFWGMMHFQRNLGMTAGQAGLWLGVQGGLTGIFGTLGGGWIADRLAARNPRHYMTPGIIGMLLTPPMLVFAWWTDKWWLALILMIFPTMFDNLSYGGVAAATQRLLSPNVRATASALMAMVGTLVGAGIGVTAFGVLSDVIREALPASAPPHQSVRYALMGAAISFLIPAFFYWRASKHVQREIQEFERA